jgi:hypothetical protein
MKQKCSEAGVALAFHTGGVFPLQGLTGPHVRRNPPNEQSHKQGNRYAHGEKQAITPSWEGPRAEKIKGVIGSVNPKVCTEAPLPPFLWDLLTASR